MAPPPKPRDPRRPGEDAGDAPEGRPRGGLLLALFLMPVFRSPEDGAKHEVGPADLYSWSVSKGLNASNVNVLAKLHDGNLSAGEAKAHEKGWTLDEATVWLQNEQTGEYLHTVGATFKRDAGKHFHAYLAKQRPDIAFSAMEWKDLLLGNIADLGGWHKVAAPVNADELELAQLQPALKSLDTSSLLNRPLECRDPARPSRV